MKTPIFILLIICICSCALSSDNREQKPSITKKDYNELKAQISKTRDSLHAKYIASDKASKTAIIKYAKGFLFEMITTDIFNCWYGTPWDFNGQSRTPQQGSIACGYFVTGVLYDAGLNIPRVNWAQQASEVFISKMSNDIKRFSNASVEEVKLYLKKKGNGLYIVGLDKHVGFVYVKGEEIKFVHSNYYQRDIGVMSEELDSDNPLKDSNYRVIGKIIDDAMVENWILNLKY